MTSRLDYTQSAPKLYAALAQLTEHIRNCGLDPCLLELIMIRASQINGCAYCIDFHSQRARKLRVDERKLMALSAWRDTAFFSARERAALEMSEAITKVIDSQVSDELYDRVSRLFSKEEIANLVFAVATINAWNRIVITFRPALPD